MSVKLVQFKSLFHDPSSSVLDWTNFSQLPKSHPQSTRSSEQYTSNVVLCPLELSFRLHPYLAQEDLRKYCTQKGIVLQAYTPSGKRLSPHLVIQKPTLLCSRLGKCSKRSCDIGTREEV